MQNFTPGCNSPCDQAHVISAGYVDIHKKLANSTPFLDDNKIYENRCQDTISYCVMHRYSQETREFHSVSYMKIGVRIQFLSAEYIDVHKKLVNYTPFSITKKKYENRGQDTIS